jgi:glycosyltransferase involved in cell wall biosynthesis
MQDALVSVVMPVYNAEKYLRSAIESILSQTYKNFELLILNDGSVDQTNNIIASFNDPRIRVLSSEKNFGLVYQLNKGIENAAGKYIARMDADDIAVASRLQRQVSFMERSPDVGLCGSFVKVFHEDKKYFATILPVTHDEICTFLLFASPFFHPAIMMRASVLRLHGIRYTKGTDSTEDYYLYLDLHDKTKMANVPKVGLYYRMHESNMSKKMGSFQKNTSDIVRAPYVHKFLQENANQNAEHLVEKHFQICSMQINTKEDYFEFMEWFKYLKNVNERKGVFKREAFLTGVAHFIYRKLISGKNTNFAILRYWMLQYLDFFRALPATYKLLFILRCVRGV